MREKNLDFQNYVAELFGSEDPIATKIRESVKAEGVENMQLSAPEAKILGLLIKMNKVQTVAEVGTLHGYSCYFMATALPEHGKIYSIDVDEERQKKARKILDESGVGHKVELICGDGLEGLKQIEGKAPFDMVFIDANKSAYPDYLEWAEVNTKSGSLIVGDNTFLFGAMYDEKIRANTNKNQVKAMETFNRHLAQSGLYTTMIIPTPEGMTVALRN